MMSTQEREELLIYLRKNLADAQMTLKQVKASIQDILMLKASLFLNTIFIQAMISCLNSRTFQVTMKPSTMTKSKLSMKSTLVLHLNTT